MTNPAMRLLLKPIGECPQIGKESGVFKKDGISHFITPASPLGSSHRFVFSVNGEIVSALQIMSADGITGKVANIYTEKRFRRNGTATALFRAVQEIFSHVEFGKDFSEDGAAWRDSVD